MNYTAATVSCYNPDTHKVVPKDAVVLTDHDLRHFGRTSEGRAKSLLDYAASMERDPGHHLAGGELLRAIARQTKPPRIPEPGLWGVVEADLLLEGGALIRSKFVRMVTGPSSEHWCDGDENWANWSDLENPALVRPGIES